MKRPTIKAFVFGDKEIHIYRKRWYLANVKLDMFISILYVNIANLKSVPIEIFAEILNVFMIVRNIRQNSDVFYIVVIKSFIKLFFKKRQAYHRNPRKPETGLAAAGSHRPASGRGSPARKQGFPANACPRRLQAACP